LSALPLLGSEPRAHLRMRPSRHDDRSSPTDTTKVEARSRQQHAIVCGSRTKSSTFFCDHILWRDTHLQKPSCAVPRDRRDAQFVRRAGQFSAAVATILPARSRIAWIGTKQAIR